MRTEDALRRLIDLQTRILAEVDAAAVVLGGGPETARAELAKARWSVSRVLREYQLFKHVEIFDPAIARGSPSQADAARRMKAACIAAGRDHAEHVARWSVSDAAAHWDEYRAAMRALVAAIRTHIRRERVDVERLLAGSERTRWPVTASPGRSPPAARADRRAR